MSFDRYSKFRNNGTIEFVPFVPIKKKSTDKFILFKKNETRLDQISYQYYNDPDYAWLIMQANPEYGSIEYFIPDKTVLRVPYPLEATLDAYMGDIDKYKKLY